MSIKLCLNISNSVIGLQTEDLQKVTDEEQVDV